MNPRRTDCPKAVTFSLAEDVREKITRLVKSVGRSQERRVTKREIVERAVRLLYLTDAEIS